MRSLICPGYLLGALIAARLMYVWQVDKQDEQNTDDALFIASASALFWPLAVAALLIFGGGYWLFARTVGRETAGQRRRRLEREAEDRAWEAAKLAEEFDLPGGEVTR